MPERAAFLLVVLSAPAAAATIRVPADHAVIQAAIDAAAEGDTVVVAPGEYVITEPITYRGKGITVRGEAGPEATTIRMAAAPTDPNRASVVVFENDETNAAVLEGVTLTGGRGMQGRGGGIYCFIASPTVAACTIRDNEAEAGGGVFCCPESSATLIDCTVRRNRAELGGGVVCGNESSAALIDCTIAENQAGSGGGVWFEFSSPAVVNCLIVGNAAVIGGGAFFEAYSYPTLTNCTIAGNTASDRGGGILSDNSSCAGLSNCIMWGNDPDGFPDNPDEAVACVRFSCVQGAGILPGDGNINSDPEFLGDGDYRLRPTSPCVDAGTPEGAPATDIEGAARPCGLAVDMGAYEYCAACRLALGSAALAECAPVHVFVDLTSEQPVQAFSFGVAHDPEAAVLTAIDFADCPAVEALNGGDGPDYFGVDLSPGTGNCSPDITAGGTVYCVASAARPSTVTIPAGADQPIARLTYEASPGNVVDIESPIAIVGCLGGELPREVVITIGGLSYTPAVIGGALSVGVPACRFRRGDGNGDGRIDISDAVSVLMYVFENRAGPLRCEDAGDANDDGALDIADPIRILGRLFADGPPFAPPYHECGRDATLDTLGCGVSTCE